MSTKKLLTKQQKECLVFGYIKQNFDIFIPIVIMKLVDYYFKDYLNWKIKSDEYLKIKSSRNIFIYSPRFTIKNIPFQFRVHSGRTRKDPGIIVMPHLDLLLNAELMPSNLIGFTIKCFIDGNVLSDDDDVISREITLNIGNAFCFDNYNLRR